ALSQGFHVQALARKPEKLPSISPLLTVTEGNALDPQALKQVMKNADVVISALNTGKNNTLSLSIPFIIQAMKEHDIKRIITIGTAGILQARSEPEHFRFQTAESKRKSTHDAEDHLKVFYFFNESDLDWTIVCPTYLPIGERRGVYRYEIDFLPENPSSISIFDTADFAFQQLFSNEFVHCRVGLTY
ncbi:MAG: NAD(P)H-binding protein, partial [Bacillota bacterium]|nr:NAD(P)H-binding protein [Bacillota bacterium]